VLVVPGVVWCCASAWCGDELHMKSLTHSVWHYGIVSHTLLCELVSWNCVASGS